MFTKLIVFLVCIYIAFSSPVGSFYIQTNSPTGNQVASFEISYNGKLNLSSLVSTFGYGGQANPTGIDGLFSQDSITVGGNYLFVVNSGSNSVTTFLINKENPSLLEFLNVVPSGGDFPVSVAYSSRRNAVCVLNGGAVNNIACFQVTERGLVSIPNTIHSLGITQTTPPTGPAGTVSDIIFNRDSSLLFVAVKGTTGVGFIASFRVSGEGQRLQIASPQITQPNGGARYFSLTLIPSPETKLLYTDPAGGYGVAAYDRNGNLVDSKFYSIATQGATCWSSYSSVTGHFYLADPGRSTIYEVSVNQATLSSTLVATHSVLASIGLSVADFEGYATLFSIVPSLPGVQVLNVNGPAVASVSQSLNLNDFVLSLNPSTTNPSLFSQTVSGTALYLRERNNSDIDHEYQNNYEHQHENQNHENDHHNEEDDRKSESKKLTPEHRL